MNETSNKKSIHIVEDDIGISEILKDILIDEGYLVSTSQNGQEALSYLKNNPQPNLILLDVMMPIMDGITFRKNQMQISEVADIPTIIMSADINISAKVETLKVQGFIKKPIDIDDIIKKIALIVD